MITDEEILNKYTKEQLLEVLHNLAYKYVFDTIEDVGMNDTSPDKILNII